MPTLENRGNGSWRITVSGGYGPDGKQIRIKKTIHVNPDSTEGAQRKQVEREAAALETDYRRHLITEAKKIRLSDVAEEYLESKPMADSTRAWYRGLLDGRILPALGKEYVQDLTARQIRAFYKDLSTADAKPARVKKTSDDKEGKKKPGSRSKTGKLSGTYRLHYHRALSAILQFAVKSGYISVSPMAAVDAPRKDTPEADFFEGQEIAKLINTLEQLPEAMWRAFFLLGLYSSARPGELIGLNWEDLQGNTLHIRAGSNYVKGKGTIRTAQPKNKSSIRAVVLPDAVIKYLQVWHKEQLEYRLQFGSCWPEPDAMFTGDRGYRLNTSTPTQRWRKYQKQYGLKDVNLYALRHTGASILIDAGCDVKEVSSRLGHSRASTTLDIYVHQFEKAQQHTADVLSAAIEAARAQAN